MKPKPYWIAVSVILLAGLALRIGMQGTLQSHFADDAYIFMRYVQNGADGHGLVYNLGDRVIGYTSPLFVVATCALRGLLHAPPLETLVSVFNTTLFVVLVLIAAVPRERFQNTLAFPLLLVFYYPYLDASMNGMETMLFVTCILGSVVCVTRSQTDLGLILAALAALTRPEGVLLLGLVVAALLWMRPTRVPVWGIAVSLLCLAAWAVFSLTYYGTLLPHSMLAKATPLATSHWKGRSSNPLDTYVMVAFGFSTSSFGKLPGVLRLLLYGLSLVSLPVIVLALRDHLRRKDLWAIFPAFFLSVWLFYCVGKPVSIWSWYTIPTSIAFLAALLPWLLRRVPLADHAGRRIGLELGVALLCAATILIGLPKRIQGEAGMTSRLFGEAEYVKQAMPRAKSVMVGDIGILGYETDLRIVDMAGLVSPEVFRRGPNGQKLTFGALVQTDAPDVLLLREDPREHDVIDDGLNRAQSFASDTEKARFDATYMLVDVNSNFFHPFVFVKRSLVTPQMLGTVGGQNR